MKLNTPLTCGTLKARRMRFLADVTLDESGDTVTAHCPNPGSMLGLKAPGMKVWLSRSDNPKRKLKYTWELADADGGLVGINTGHPNGIVSEALSEGRIPELAAYGKQKREVKYGKNSRIDMLLSEDGLPDCYVEVKNVHLMRRSGLAEFPDSVTKRGAKHLDELADQVDAGHRAVMFYLIQRTDCAAFSLASDIDPAYATAFAAARERGVEVLVYRCNISTQEITVGDSVSLEG